MVPLGPWRQRANICCRFDGVRHVSGRLSKRGALWPERVRQWRRRWDLYFNGHVCRFIHLKLVL